MQNKIFVIRTDGASYQTLYNNVEFPCQTCGVIVNKLSYSERSGIGEWICPEMHLSKEKIGV